MYVSAVNREREIAWNSSMPRDSLIDFLTSGINPCISVLSIERGR